MIGSLKKLEAKLLPAAPARWYFRDVSFDVGKLGVPTARDARKRGAVGVCKCACVHARVCWV